MLRLVTDLGGEISVLPLPSDMVARSCKSPFQLYEWKGSHDATRIHLYVLAGDYWSLPPFTLSSIEWLIESELPTLVQLEASGGKTEALGKSCSQVMRPLCLSQLDLGARGLGCFA